MADKISKNIHQITFEDSKPCNEIKTNDNNTFPQKLKPFNFLNEEDDVDLNNPVQILDLKKTNIQPKQLISSLNTNTQDTWKLCVLYPIKNSLTGARKKIWINDFEKIRNRNGVNLLRKLKKTFIELTNNEAMMRLSKAKLELLDEYCQKIDLSLDEDESFENNIKYDLDNIGNNNL